MQSTKTMMLSVGTGKGWRQWWRARWKGMQRPLPVVLWHSDGPCVLYTLRWAEYVCQGCVRVCLTIAHTDERRRSCRVLAGRDGENWFALRPTACECALMAAEISKGEVANVQQLANMYAVFAKQAG